VPSCLHVGISAAIYGIMDRIKSPDVTHHIERFPAEQDGPAKKGGALAAAPKSQPKGPGSSLLTENV